MAFHSGNDKWLKAAVVGSLWGASEIVLGSFLHNLKIPFSGNLLTAIAIVIMIAGHRLWPERGIIIRAGLICAALKTMSPSASIMGPMIAITMQATLMEVALLLGRSTWFGYLLGGGLAMSWNIFHRIFTSIVLYGGTLIELYKSLIDYFIRQTGWQVEGYLAPLLLLASIFFVTGMAAATAGIYISRLAQNYRATAPTIRLQSASHNDEADDSGAERQSRKHADREAYKRQASSMESAGRQAKRMKSSSRQASAIEQSGRELPGYMILLRIVTIIALLVVAMMSITRIPLAAAAVILVAYLFMVWKIDARLLGRFIYKKGFWISMSIMLLLSAFLLRQDVSNTAFSLAGLQAGIEMMMRAMYVITGFGLISRELRSKSLITWFENRRMKGFLDAMRLSFQTTPLLIENIPGKKAWKRPTMVLSTMIASMEDAYEQMRSTASSDARHHQRSDPSANNPQSSDQTASPSLSAVIIITGNKGSGKSTLLAAVVEKLRKKGIGVSGIVAPELVENGERLGYYVQDADSGEKKILCRRPDEEPAGQQTGEVNFEGKNKGYVFDEDAIAFGEKVLDSACRDTLRPLRSANVLVIDELGPYELKGQGWAAAMDKLYGVWDGPMLWVVRESLIEAMLQRWPAKTHRVFRVGESSADEIIEAIMLHTSHEATSG